LKTGWQVSRLLDPKITYVQLSVLKMLRRTIIGLFVCMCVYVCVTDHDSKNLYTVLMNLDNVTYEAASIQGSTSSLGPGSKNGVEP
jgi:hypothetical protein